MRNKDSRLEAIKMVVSAQDISSQEELLRELKKVGFKLTQATLSRDLKQLKVAKATNASGKYVYVLPASPLYRRVSGHPSDRLCRTSGRCLVREIFRQSGRGSYLARPCKSYRIRYRQQKV